MVLSVWAWKQKKVFNGNRQHPYDPRKLAHRNHKWKQCLSLSSVSRVLFTCNSFHKASQPSLLCGNNEAVMWSCAQKKAWTLAQQLDFPPCQCSSSQGGLLSSFWPENRLLKCNTHPFPLVWLQMTSGCSKNEVCLRGMKISGYWRHPNKCDDCTESCSTTGVPKMFLTVAASLGSVHSCSRGVPWRWPLSISCKYTGMRLAIKAFRELHSHTSYIRAHEHVVVIWNKESNCLSTWSIILLNLTVTQLVKNFLTLYGTRKFITVFTITRHFLL